MCMSIVSLNLGMFGPAFMYLSIGAIHFYKELLDKVCIKPPGLPRWLFVISIDSKHMCTPGYVHGLNTNVQLQLPTLEGSRSIHQLKPLDVENLY